MPEDNGGYVGAIILMIVTGIIASGLRFCRSVTEASEHIARSKARPTPVATHRPLHETTTTATPLVHGLLGLLHHSEVCRIDSPEHSEFLGWVFSMRIIQQEGGDGNQHAKRCPAGGAREHGSRR